jgi:hypothetical protein
MLFGSARVTLVILCGLFLPVRVEEVPPVWAYPVRLVFVPAGLTGRSGTAPHAIVRLRTAA